MSQPTLFFVSPHPAGSIGLPNRPARLLAAFIDARAFDEVIVINRLRPTDFLGRARGRRPTAGGGLPGAVRRLPSGAILVEHPWPFGALERRFVQGVLTAHARRSSAGIVAWVADPKSVPAVVRPPERGPTWPVVVDAYDAWDRSPLVRGGRRLRAVADGYAAAASGADLIFTNTLAMRDRLRELGARDARHLPNACPPLDHRLASTDRRRAGLVYVGRIHERFDAELTVAVADALPDTMFTIAGPVEREPVGWSALAGRANVRLPGLVEPGAARDLIAGAAGLIVPHRVDDYTRSQDAMKAWDAIASGTPVISTPIPPADSWPAGYAEVCFGTDAFVAAARRAVDGELDIGRPARLAFATENQWSARAAVAIAAIDSVILPDAGQP